MKQVAVVILNWNGRDFLQKFLPSVVEHSAAKADIYVVDNASTDDSVEFIRTSYPEIQIVLLGENFGFAKGYNVGLSEVKNEILVLLNSDVEVTANWIDPVVQYMQSVKNMVACQPKILDYNRRQYFEYAGAAGGYLDRNGFAFCAGRIFNSFEVDAGQFKVDSEVFWASGASLFIYRSAYMEVGGLDEDFYAHMEEIDLCWRLKNRGYKIGACRNSIVYHMGGGTLTRDNPLKTYLNFRNNLYLLIKNYRSGSLFLKMIKRMTLDGAAAIHFLTEGKWSYFLAVLKAHFSCYGHFKTFLRKRKSELAHSKQPNLTGVYEGSIVREFFIGKIRYFSDLDQRKFHK